MDRVEESNMHAQNFNFFFFFFFHFSLGTQFFAGEKKFIKYCWRCETDDLDFYHINLNVD